MSWARRSWHWTAAVTNCVRASVRKCIQYTILYLYQHTTKQKFSGKYAQSEAVKSVNKLHAYVLQRKRDKHFAKSKSETTDHDSTVLVAEKNPSKPSKSKKQRESLSKQCGLVFSVSRIKRCLKTYKYCNRCSIGAAVCMSAVLEYLCSEVLDLAIDVTRANARRLIKPRFVMLAVKNDEELSVLLSHVIIPQSGVVPNIHSALFGGRGRYGRRPCKPCVRESPHWNMKKHLHLYKKKWRFWAL